MESEVASDFLMVDDKLLCLERELWAEGFAFVAGVDEAGRGPLAGPVVAAAVCFAPDAQVPKVFDSKQLSESIRERLFEELLRSDKLQYCIAIRDAERIDEINILRATHEAMREAAAGISQLEYVLVDGLPVRGFEVPSRGVVKGDAKSASIAAASILAKVTRDRMMLELDKLYPEYGFARHKGYGTAEHLAALNRYGVTPCHRRSFAPVKKLLPGAPEQLELF